MAFRHKFIIINTLFKRQEGIMALSDLGLLQLLLSVSLDVLINVLGHTPIHTEPVHYNVKFLNF